MFVGGSIQVLEIDKRIAEYLPEDEKDELISFIGDIFLVEKINSDGSMIVTKSWECKEVGETLGHEVAIFSVGAQQVAEQENHNKSFVWDAPLCWELPCTWLLLE